MERMKIKEESLHKHEYWAIDNCVVDILDTASGKVDVRRNRYVIQKVNKKTGKVVITYDQNLGKRVELAEHESEPKQVGIEIRLWALDENEESLRQFVDEWYTDVIETCKKGAAYFEDLKERLH